MSDEINIQKVYRFREFIRRDFWYILAVLIALFTVVYMGLNEADYQEKCNTHWIEELNNSCECENLKPYEQDFRIGYVPGVYNGD